MINENPILAVIMPVYNSQNTVYFSIRSVLNQSYKNFEFIIINDGSTDNSENIIKSFEDGRIKYYKIEHKGLSFALNYGISKTNAKYIARLDSDDLYLKDKLNKQMTYLVLNNEIDIIFSWSIFYNNSGLLRFWKSPSSDENIKEIFMYTNPINHSSVIFKKDIITKLKGYNEIYDYEDYDLWLRASKQSQFFCLQEYLVFSFLREDKFTKKYYKDLISFLTENIINNDNSSLKKRNDLLGRVEFFYGDILKCREMLLKGNILSNLLLLIYTFLPKFLLVIIRGKKLSLFFSIDICKIYYYKKILKQLLN